MITEDQLEKLAIQWFQDTGWTYANGADLAPFIDPQNPNFDEVATCKIDLPVRFGRRLRQ